MFRKPNRMAIVALAGVAAAFVTGTAQAGPYPLDTLHKMLKEAQVRLEQVEARIVEVVKEIKYIESAMGDPSAGLRRNDPKFRLDELKKELFHLYAERAILIDTINWLNEQIAQALDRKNPQTGPQVTENKPGSAFRAGPSKRNRPTPAPSVTKPGSATQY